MKNKVKIKEAIVKLNEAKKLLESAVTCYEQLIDILDEKGKMSDWEQMHNDIGNLESAVDGIDCVFYDLNKVDTNVEYDF